MDEYLAQKLAPEFIAKKTAQIFQMGGGHPTCLDPSLRDLDQTHILHAE